MVQQLTNLDFGGVAKPVNVAAPVNPSDTATKAYVDAVAQGLSAKPSAILATAVALPTNTYANGSSGVGATLTGVATGTLTVDGSAVSLNDYVLVKNEAAAANNGLYQCTLAGAVGVAYILTRAVEMDSATEINGAFVFVESGTSNAGSGWVCTNSTVPTIGTTAINFVKFSSSASYTAGSGVTITGSVISSNMPYIDATGTADALVATFTPAIPALYDGLNIRVGAALVNATSTPTLNVNGLGAVVITKNTNNVLDIGDIGGSNHALDLIYNSAIPTWNLLNPALVAPYQPWFNAVPNPSCAIQSRQTAGIAPPTITTAYAIGSVDSVGVKHSGGTLAAGTVSQNGASLVGVNGVSARAVGVTTTGGDVLSFAWRIEAKNAIAYASKVVSLQVAVAHDIGANTNYTLKINQAAGGVDTFTTIANIATSSAMVVPTATGTILKLENILLPSTVSNGIEIEVQVQAFNVTLKNFDVANCALTLGSVTPKFQSNLISDDVRTAERYLPYWVAPSTQNTLGPATLNTATTVILTIPFQTTTRKSLTGVLSSSAGMLALVAATSYTSTVITYFGNSSVKDVTLVVSYPTAVNGSVRLNLGAYLLGIGAEMFP